MPDVLVVDDDADIRILVAMALEDAGCSVRTVSDGASALTSIEAKAPDVVVLDVMMPGMDGYQVVRTMRAIRPAPATKVLMLTTRLGERDRLRGLGDGADDYLTKPYDPTELVAKVKWLLRSSDEERAARREAEVRKAELLDRLESAFSKQRR
jgi:DNA-binding response OmpR family regulator